MDLSVLKHVCVTIFYDSIVVTYNIYMETTNNELNFKKIFGFIS